METDDPRFIDSDGHTKFMLYVIHATKLDAGFVKEICSKAEVDLNAQNKEGLTAMHLCSLKVNCPRSVWIQLCRLGADPNLRSVSGQNVLSYYLIFNHEPDLEVIKCLIMHGAETTGIKLSVLQPF